MSADLSIFSMVLLDLFYLLDYTCKRFLGSAALPSFTFHIHVISFDLLLSTVQIRTTVHVACCTLQDTEEVQQ
jgi:hypothetical protein